MEQKTAFGANMLVIGIGGAGNNAINRMIDENVTAARLVAMNTDLQDLMFSKASDGNKIRIGDKSSKGIGAGADPKVGEVAATKSMDTIRTLLDGVDLLFIAAGMGGGTGTGAAPVVAEEAKRRKILVIAVVTCPFAFEGEVRRRNADVGLENLKKHVDSMIIVPNEHVASSVPQNTPMKDVMAMADDVLRLVVQSITDIIATRMTVNVDLADLRTVLADSGKMHFGYGRHSGERAIVEATKDACRNKFICSDIQGAQRVLLTIRGGASLSKALVLSAGEAVRSIVDPKANIITGYNNEDDLEDNVIVTIIASGLDNRAQDVWSKKEETKYVEKPIDQSDFDFGFEQRKSVPTAPQTVAPRAGQPVAPQNPYYNGNRNFNVPNPAPQQPSQPAPAEVQEKRRLWKK